MPTERKGPTVRPDGTSEPRETALTIISLQRRIELIESALRAASIPIPTIVNVRVRSDEASDAPRFE